MENNQYENFKFFDGSWMSKKSVYLLKKKLQYQYQEFIHINKNSSKYEIGYKLLKNKAYIFHNYIDMDLLAAVQKYNNLMKIYNINDQQFKLSKINTKKNQKNLFYKEYIYSTNKNLQISIGFIKNQKNYLAIIFTSYIKILN